MILRWRNVGLIYFWNFFSLANKRTNKYYCTFFLNSIQIWFWLENLLQKLLKKVLKFSRPMLKCQKKMSFQITYFNRFRNSNGILFQNKRFTSRWPCLHLHTSVTISKLNGNEWKSSKISCYVLCTSTYKRKQPHAHDIRRSCIPFSTFCRHISTFPFALWFICIHNCFIHIF